MQNINATINPLYAVPMMHCLIPGHERLNRELTALLLELESQGDLHRDGERRDTQVGIFESNFFLHERSDACIATLFAHIRQAIHALIQGINAYSDTQIANIQLDMHSWFHITRKGGYQGAHRHPNASWSAIYCVDPGDSKDPKSGAVRFHDPKSDTLMYMDPAIANLQMPYRLGNWELVHKPGQMLVFPSYLLHEIFTYTGERPRIVIALNAWGRWRQAPG